MTSTLEQRTNSIWDTVPGLDDRLRQLLRTEPSRSKIAIRLCEEFPPHNINRNMVTGRAWRLGLAPPRPRGERQPVVTIRREQRPPRRKPVNARPNGEPPDPSFANIPFEDLAPSSCRWPVNNDAPWMFCGKRKLDGKVYCGEHCAIAYTGPRR